MCVCVCVYVCVCFALLTCKDTIFHFFHDIVFMVVHLIIWASSNGN